MNGMYKELWFKGDKDITNAREAQQDSQMTRKSHNFTN